MKKGSILFCKPKPSFIESNTKLLNNTISPKKKKSILKQNKKLKSRMKSNERYESSDRINLFYDTSKDPISSDRYASSAVPQPRLKTTNETQEL